MATERSISPEARSILGARISRRSVLAGAGGLGAVGLLAACGGGGDSAAENIVRWGNWPLYLDFDEASKTYPTLVKFSLSQLESMPSTLKITTTTMSSLEKCRRNSSSAKILAMT